MTSNITPWRQPSRPLWLVNALLRLAGQHTTSWQRQIAKAVRVVIDPIPIRKTFVMDIHILESLSNKGNRLDLYIPAVDMIMA